MYEENAEIYIKTSNNLLGIGRVSSTPEAGQVCITFDGVGEIENSFFQLTA